MVTSDGTLFVFVLCPLNILPVKADNGVASNFCNLRLFGIELKPAVGLGGTS